jgi:hypothetical protein
MFACAGSVKLTRAVHWFSTAHMVQFTGSDKVHMEFFLYMNQEAYPVVITGEHCIQE